MKIEKTISDFVRESGLPARGTEEELAKVGAVYLSTRPIIYQCSKLVRDVMVLHKSNGEIYIWGREFQDQPFTIHRSGQMNVEYSQPMSTATRAMGAA